MTFGDDWGWGSPKAEGYWTQPKSLLNLHVLLQTDKVRRAFYQSLPPSSHIAKRFKLTDASIIAIRAGTSVYGSQAQALLVAAEVLSRLREPIKLPESLVAGNLVGMPYKIDPRVVRLLNVLKKQYGTARRVMAACAYIISTAP